MLTKQLHLIEYLSMKLIHWANVHKDYFLHGNAPLLIWIFIFNICDAGVCFLRNKRSGAGIKQDSSSVNHAHARELKWIEHQTLYPGLC